MQKTAKRQSTLMSKKYFSFAIMKDVIRYSIIDYSS